MDLLRTHGWDDHFEAALAELGVDQAEAARVVEEQRGIYRVVTAGGELRAEVAGRLLQADTSTLPAVGDWVVLDVLEGEERAVIRQVLARRSQISRKAAGRTSREQVLAANVDTVFLVTSFNEDLNPRRIERYLTLIWESGASPVVLLNKSDLTGDPENDLALAGSAAPGVPVHAVCAKREGGLHPLEPYLKPGSTVVLLGSSGVGKSTIVNRLMGEEVQDVQEVLARDSKGRHTTTSRQLFLLPSGALVLDTPGLRELGLWLTESGLDRTFVEIEELARGCRFQDCTHDSEPGCAVKDAVADGRLAADRLASFHKLRKELQHLQRKVDPEDGSNVKRRWRAIQKNMRAARKQGWFPDKS